MRQEPLFITDGGIAVTLGPPDMLVEFDDPQLPTLRTKQINEVASGTFDVNGIKRYWAGCDGKRCVVAGWGE